MSALSKKQAETLTLLLHRQADKLGGKYLVYSPRLHTYVRLNRLSLRSLAERGLVERSHEWVRITAAGRAALEAHNG